MKTFIVVLGYVIAKMPERLLRGLCVFAAHFIDVVMPSRMRIAYSNLSHCFPEVSREQIRKTGLESAARMVEMGLFVLASPHIEIEKLKRRISLDGGLLEKLSAAVENPRPIVIVIPHFCMMESITIMPALVDAKLPKVGVFYRPFDNAAVEEWVKNSRQRCNITLLSRKRGTRAAVDFLRSNGCVGLLFDQNSGGNGSLGIFMDRLCHTTELPRILAEHEKAKIACIYAKRTGFWRAKISGNWLECPDYDDAAFAMNSWLGGLLKSDAQLRQDWLWLHRRWARGYLFGMPKFRAGEYEKCLAESGGAFKRVCRILITPPASLRGLFALVPLLKCLRNSRPDASVTLVCEARFYGVVSVLPFADEILRAPDAAKTLARIRFFNKLGDRYFDVHAVFDDSPLSDLEARLACASDRLAIQYPSRRRRFFNRVYNADFASEADSLFSVYEKAFRSFGLVGDADFSPLGKSRAASDGDLRIALICGGRGNHALSSAKWGALVKSLDRSFDDARFEVYGDEPDARTAFEITSGAEYAEIKNYAGKLTDAQMMERLGECTVAVGTDCRLTHIANALGVPVVAVYGQTNPIRNGLVFDAPKAVVRPRNSPPQGGVPVENAEVGDIASAVLNLIKEK